MYVLNQCNIFGNLKLHVTLSNQQHYIKLHNDSIHTNGAKFLLSTKIHHIQVQLYSEPIDYTWYFIKLPTALTIDSKLNSKLFSTLLYSPQEKLLSLFKHTLTSNRILLEYTSNTGT